MNIFLVSPHRAYEWDWRTPDTVGLGGSETNQIEMAWRLAARGHRVVSYAAIPVDTPTPWRGVEWRPYQEAAYDEPGLWVVSRSTEGLDRLHKRPGQVVWFLLHDVEPHDNAKRLPTVAPQFDRVLTLCRAHRNYVGLKQPYLKEKLCISTNGLRLDLVEKVEKSQPFVRKPYRFTFASSYQKGLLPTLWLFEELLKAQPQAELHVCYGSELFVRMIEAYRDEPEAYEAAKGLWAAIQEMRERLPNVFWHGKTSQPELFSHWLQTGIWPYTCTSRETNCITAMEAQALGAIPIANAWWGLEDNVRHGWTLRGEAYEGPVLRKYLAKTLELAEWSQTPDGERYRQHMMTDARQHFNWERTVDQWERWLAEDLGT